MSSEREERKAARQAAKAAERRAEWDREVKARAAADAVKVHNERVVAKQKTDAIVNRVRTRIEKSESEGKPMRFNLLKVAVVDGEVFATEGGPRLMGPLKGASATVKDLPPKVVRRSLATQFVFLVNPSRSIPRVETEVHVGRRVQRATVSEKAVVALARRQVEDFNTLVRLAG